MDNGDDNITTCERPSWFRRQWSLLRHCEGGFSGLLFVCMPRVVYSAVRFIDRWLHRSYGGLWQRVFMEGHSAVPFVTALLVFTFLLLGPTLSVTVWPVVTTLVAVFVVFWLAVRSGWVPETGWRGLFALQVAIILTLFVVFFLILPSPAAREVDGVVYRHVFAPLTAVLMVVAALAPLLARLMLRDCKQLGGRFAQLLERTELFVVPRLPKAGWRRVLHGLINAPLYHSLQLLLLPAFFVVLARREYIVTVAVVCFVVAYLLLVISGIHERMSLMITVVKRWFLIGGQLVVSLLIIVLAVARLADVSYVATLLDASPWRIILQYIVAAYGAFWLYEYWINRALTERMLRLLDPHCAEDGCPARIPYAIKAEAVTTNVVAKGRTLEIFSGARLAVVGRYRPRQGSGLCPAWEPYEKIDVFQALAANAAAQQDWSDDDRADIKIAVGELRKRARLYFNLLNALLLILLVVTVVWTRQIDEAPLATGQRLDSGLTTQAYDLRRALFDAPPASGRAIVLAASGGGTRAALYTASMLRALAQTGHARDVVLLSGVSGGGVALAYFAAHHEALINASPGACTAEALRRFRLHDVAAVQPGGATGDVWCEYFAAMSQPYIEHVLRGVWEFSLLGDKTLGHLLDEALQFGFRVHNRSTPLALNDVRGVGLVLNTALAGHPYTDSALLAPLAQDDSVARHYAYSTGSGGRLAFTNVRSVGAFPLATDAPADARDEHLKYVIVGGERVALTAAAALNANFPPVFPNGIVAVEDAQHGAQRYWVTDGGAVDNRGIISLLYALLSALQEQKQMCGQDCAKPAQTPPTLHIVVADASAASIDYDRHDRGLGPKFGAAQKFASQLMIELSRQAKTLYRELGGDLSVHYVPMPGVLRIRGGLGTHWMMPEQVTLHEIYAPAPKFAHRLTLTKGETLELILALHEPASSECREPTPSPPSDQPLDWVRNDPHSCAWTNLLEGLQAPRP